MTVDINNDPEYRPGGRGGMWFCSSPHPTEEYVWCRRAPEHDGDCAAYVFDIKQPARWPKP